MTTEETLLMLIIGMIIGFWLRSILKISLVKKKEEIKENKNIK